MTDVDDTSRITIRMVFDAVNELKDDLSGVPSQVKDHEVRIRAIEKYLWIWIGASGIAGAGIGQIATALFNR